jgi:flagellar basal-body rod protein FlgG
VLEGMYTAAAGMAAQQQRLAALSNDLANVNTTGYKRVRVAFRDLVYTPAGPGTAPGIQEGAGAAAKTVGRGAAQGALKRTDRSLDVAIDGPGFIRVRNGAGAQVVTRDGALQIDSRGRLVTNQGHLTGVTLPRGTSEGDVNIGANGIVTVAGRNVGSLDLVTVRATDGLAANGDNTYSLTAASGGANDGGVRVANGALEMSNVDVADAMTDMIEAQRSFELASRAIRMQDQMAEIANGVKRG